VTNAVTGIATAYMDSIPMVIISGQVPTAYIGQDAFQEVDTVGITRPCVKHNFLVKDVATSPRPSRRRSTLQETGRPARCWSTSRRTSRRRSASTPIRRSVSMRSYNPVVKGHQGQIKKAVQLLLEAKRPMIYTGGGVVLSEAGREAHQAGQAARLPVTNTLMGLGGYPATDKQFVGMLGMHGTYEANMAMQHCDVLLAVGARFDDRVIGNPEHFAEVPRKIIHIDIDPSSISKRVKVDVPIVGDVPKCSTMIAKLLAASGERPDEKALKAWWKQIDEWRARIASSTTARARSSSRSSSSRSSTK
jgi:acetolactate synthase-1/2/3 large subunit